MADILGTTPSSTDLSSQLLIEIFGGDWWSASTDKAGFLYTILGAMNTITLTLLLLMTVYHIWSGVTSTAHEGQLLGSRMNTIWMPLRAVFGISMLSPVFSGLSILQVFILGIVSMSISASNYVVSEALDQLNLSATEIITQNPQLRQNARYMASVILQNRIAQQWAAATDQAEISSKGIVYAETVADDIIRYQFTANKGTGNDKDMGYIEVCNDGSTVCAARQKAVLQMVANAGTPANTIVQMVMAQESWEGISDDTIDNLVDPYVSSITSAIDTYISAEKNKFTLDEVTTNTTNEGWLSFGTVYWQFSQLSGSIYSVINDLPSAAPMTSEQYIVTEIVGGATAQTYWMRRQQTAYNDVEDMEITDIRSFESAKKWLRIKINGMVDPLLSNATDMLTKGDIVANMSAVGHYSLDLSEALVGLGLTAKGVAKLVGYDEAEKKGDSVLGGVGKIPGLGWISGVANTALAGLLHIYQAALAIASALFGLGMSLAYYLPAIPIIYWIAGTLTWIISIVEAMIAAPIWALGHAQPGRDGHGLIGQSAVTGYYLLANLFLRPALMVLGLIVAMLLMRVAGIIINATFVRYILDGMLVDKIHGPLTVLAFFSLLVIVMISAAHQVFALITTMPDMVMRWIDKTMPSSADRQQVEGAGVKFGGAAVGAGSVAKHVIK